jgi:hypothetical protein
VQEQRFLAPAVEHEGIAPLQARHGLAFARLVGDQEADRVLVERLRRGGADIDALGFGPRHPQQARVHPMVVDDDVGGPQEALPANADQGRIPGARPDEVNARRVHGPRLTSSRMSTAPASTRSSAS